MNLESSSAENHMDALGQLTPPADGLQANRSKAEQLSQEFAGEIDADSIEAALCRASTLMLDFPPQPPERSHHSPASDKAKYVQGIVQGSQAYIVTNLIGEQSQALLQPQMVWTIGRNREAALSLQDRIMSRRHAVILYLKKEGFYLIDLNSMNGTFLNGVKVQQRHLLKDGDRIGVGNIEFTFFVSCRARSLEAIHPEVLARLNTPGSRSEPFIDYLAMEES